MVCDKIRIKIKINYSTVPTFSSGYNGKHGNFLGSTKITGSTQPGHPSVGRRNEYQRKLNVNRHTARCTSPVSVVWQCKLVSG